ncbi:hypothetical protein pb186bvf_016163 [Paramecium bursaria]
MIKETENKCSNYYCNNSSQKIAKFLDQDITFCDGCFDLYQDRRCCYFCAQVYRDDEQNFLDGMQWIQCDIQKCGRWIHIECEETSIEIQIQNKNFKYRCPWCRIKSKQKKCHKPLKQPDQDPDYQSAQKKVCLDERLMSQKPKTHFLMNYQKRMFQQCINQEDLQNDLCRLRSLVD